MNNLAASIFSLSAGGEGAYLSGQKKSFVSSPTTTRFLENLETFFYFYFFYFFIFLKIMHFLDNLGPRKKNFLARRDDDLMPSRGPRVILISFVACEATTIPIWCRSTLCLQLRWSHLRPVWCRMLAGTLWSRFVPLLFVRIPWRQLGESYGFSGGIPAFDCDLAFCWGRLVLV